MRLIVSDIPEDGLELESDVPVETGVNSEPDSAHASLTFLRFGKSVLVEGSIQISVSMRCSRCLGDFLYPLDITFKEEYTPSEDLDPDGEHELTGSELNIGFYSNDEIDTGELVKEQVLLSIPMKPLCSRECRGICPECGINLNERACNCSAERIDPRLAPLKRFMKTNND
jgi:uncharacterized protein